MQYQTANWTVTCTFINAHACGSCTLLRLLAYSKGVSCSLVFQLTYGGEYNNTIGSTSNRFGGGEGRELGRWEMTSVQPFVRGSCYGKLIPTLDDLCRKGRSSPPAKVPVEKSVWIHGQ